jgi:hypothetical protein
VIELVDEQSNIQKKKLINNCQIRASTLLVDEFNDVSLATLQILSMISSIIDHLYKTVWWI